MMYPNTHTCANIVVADWVLLQCGLLITQTAVPVCHLNHFMSTNYAMKLISLQLEHSCCSHSNNNSSTAAWDTHWDPQLRPQRVLLNFLCCEYLKCGGIHSFTLCPRLMTVL